MHRLLGRALIILALAGCESPTPVSPRTPLVVKNTIPYVEAARRLTQRYTESPMAGWNVKADAAGRNCDVLFIETAVVLETSMVDAIHYGVAAYDFLPGGVKQFGRKNAFRGVAYKDASGFIWTYGDITTADAQSLRPCR
jgi:hypothetical protein